MSAFDNAAALPPQQVWDGILARSVHGERLTVAIVELDPDAVVAEHSHDHEQLGLVLRGSMRFRVGDEERELGPRRHVVYPVERPPQRDGRPRWSERDRRLRPDQGRLARLRTAGAAARALALTAAFPRVACDQPPAGRKKFAFAQSATCPPIRAPCSSARRKWIPDQTRASTTSFIAVEA